MGVIVGIDVEGTEVGFGDVGTALLVAEGSGVGVCVAAPKATNKVNTRASQSVVTPRRVFIAPLTITPLSSLLGLAHESSGDVFQSNSWREILLQ